MEVLLKTPVEVTFTIKKEGKWYWGYINEYSGIMDQGRTINSLKSKLINMLKDIALNTPEVIEEIA